jgi:hypothetical protein
LRRLIRLAALEKAFAEGKKWFPRQGSSNVWMKKASSFSIGKNAGRKIN